MFCDEFFVLSLGSVVVDTLVELTSLTVVLVVVVILNVVVPFLSVEVVVKDVVVDHFFDTNFCWKRSMQTMLILMLSCLLFCLMLSIMLSLTSSKSILLMSGLAVEDVIVEVLSIFVAKLLVERLYVGDVHFAMFDGCGAQSLC